jgi:uncharacterized protein YbaR (Trm112 family)
MVDDYLVIIGKEALPATRDNLLLLKRRSGLVIERSGKRLYKVKNGVPDPEVIIRALLG